MKAHIHTKCRQFKEITRITHNLNEDGILTHHDYSENYKCQHQNEIQSAYFGNKILSLFTARACYKQNEKIQKLPTTATTEEIGKCQAASMSCVYKVITYSIDKISQTINLKCLHCQRRMCCSILFEICVQFLHIFSKRYVPGMAL